MDETTRSRIRQLSTSDLLRLKKSLARSSMDGYSLVAKALKDCGIKRLSSLCGMPAFGVIGATAKQGIRALGTRRQFSATIMAGVDNYISGKLVHAICVSPGPGITEVVTGIYVASDNNLPLLVVGCGRPLSSEGSGDFQDFNGAQLLQGITKSSARINAVRDIMPAIREACETAINGEPGPVYVEVPEDLLESSGIPSEISFPRRKNEDITDEKCIEKIKRLLGKSRRPLICLGEDLRWGYSLDVLERFISGFQMPFITTPMGRGLLPDDHALCANSVRRKIIHHADCFILAGAWFDWRLRKGSELSERCEVIHIHPNPECLGKNVPGATTCCADPMPVLEQLARNVPMEPPMRLSWKKDISLMRKKYQGPFPKSWTGNPAYIAPEVLFRSLQGKLNRDSILAVDGSVLLSLALHYLESYEPFSRFDPGRNGCIGSGIPQAMGACLAEPGRQVVALVGDTGFGMSGMELETAVRHGMNLKVIIANNSGISGALRQRETFGDNYPEQVARFQEDLPYHKIAEALGVPGWSVETCACVEEVLEAAFSIAGPACVNVRMDPDLSMPAIW